MVEKLRNFIDLRRPWREGIHPSHLNISAATELNEASSTGIVLKIDQTVGALWSCVEPLNQGQVAEPLTAASSVYCREDDISSDPSAQCYWETFMKGSIIG